jgi:hypothetical protein
LTGDTDEHETEAIVIRVSLNEHLDALRVAENQKPLNQRREVPTVADLARATGINRASLYNWAGNKYESTRHDMAAAVINELHRLGFPASLSDILQEHPASTVSQAK